MPVPPSVASKVIQLETHTSTQACCVSVDAQDNVTVGGYFNGDISVGATTLATFGALDGYAIKFAGSSPSLYWAGQIGGTNYDQTTALASENGGNTWIAGYFNVNADLDPSAGVHAVTGPAGTQSGFLVNVDIGGNLQSQFTINGFVVYPTSVAVHPSGDVIVGGQFYGPATFGPGVTRTSGNGDGFVARYRRDGALVWVKTFGGPNSDMVRAVAVGSSGDIAVGGYYTGTTTGDIALSGDGSSDAFIAKFDESGGLVWVNSIRGPGDDVTYGVAIDPAGGPFACGNYSGGAIDTSGLPLAPSRGESDVFVVHYNTDGSGVWSRTGGGAKSDVALGMSYDPDIDRLFVVGAFVENATFEDSPTTVVGDGLSDLFVARYNGAGALVWLRDSTGPGSADAKSVFRDRLGNVWVAGNFQGTKDIDGPGASVALTAVGTGLNGYLMSTPDSP